MFARIPTAQTIPRLARPWAEAVANDPNPIADEVPQKSNAFPIPALAAAISPPFRLKARSMWIP